MRPALIILAVLTAASAALWAIDRASLHLMQSNAALRDVVLTPEFTLLSIFGGVVVALAPVVFTACLIRSARPTGRTMEPEDRA